MKIEEIIDIVADELGLPHDVAYLAYMSAWKCMKEKIEALPLMTCTLEEFRQLRPNFNMPAIGKFYVTEEDFLKAKKKFEIIEKYKELKKQRNQNAEILQDNSGVQSDSDNR
jgi:hypothetical protein